MGTANSGWDKEIAPVSLDEFAIRKVSKGVLGKGNPRCKCILAQRSLRELGNSKPEDVVGEETGRNGSNERGLTAARLRTLGVGPGFRTLGSVCDKLCVLEERSGVASTAHLV